MRWIDEMNAFYHLIEINQVSTSAIALWHALMYINNRHFWSNEFSASNITLQSMTGLSRSGILKARNALKQMGLLDFKPKGTKATTYILHSVIANSKQDSVQVSTQVSTQDSVQASTQVSTQDGGLYSTPIEILNNNKTKDIKTKDKTRARYGEYNNVLLSDEQYGKLKAEFPNDYDQRIEQVSAYCASTGKSYKDYLATIRNWARRDRGKADETGNNDSFDLDEFFEIALKRSEVLGKS